MSMKDRFKTPGEVYTLAVDVERIARVIRKELEDGNLGEPGTHRLADNLVSGATQLQAFIKSYPESHQ
jgi:hypothetical protein